MKKNIKYLIMKNTVKKDIDRFFAQFGIQGDVILFLMLALSIFLIVFGITDIAKSTTTMLGNMERLLGVISLSVGLFIFIIYSDKFLGRGR